MRLRPFLSFYLLFGAFCVTYLLSAAIRAPQPWALQIGVPGDQRFSSGFFLAERSEGLPFRWSGPGARLVLHGGDGMPLALLLRLNGDQLAQSGDPMLRLVPDQLPKRPIGFATTPGWRVYHLLTPAQTGLQAPGFTLDSATHRPGPNDGRDLGVAVSTLRLSPVDTQGRSWLLQGWPLHPRALFLTWVIALAGMAIWQASQGKGRQAAVDVGLYLVPLALAGALLLWARRSPYSLAAALPPLPWTLGLASVALLAGPVVGWLRSATEKLPGKSRAGIGDRWFWAGVAVVVVAQMLLYGQTLVGLGIALALVGLALLMAATQVPNAEAAPLPASGAAKQPFYILHPTLSMLGIFALALTLRFYQIDGLPFGLWRDEARHGLVALRILEEPDYRPIYVAGGGVNMPALIFYPFALAIKIWGIYPWAMRPVTALAGALTVLPLYGLVRRLFAVGPALLAALLLAVSSWHITLSRFSFPTVFDPLFGLAGLWLLAAVLGEQKNRRTEEQKNKEQKNKEQKNKEQKNKEQRTKNEGTREQGREIEEQRNKGTTELGGEEPGGESRRLGGKSFALLLLAGACLGLAVQTYHTGRVVPLVAGLLVLGLCEGKRREATGSAILKEYLVPLGLSLLPVGIGFLLVAGPMLGYALRQQRDFNDRVSGVFLLSDGALKGAAPLAALDDTLGRHLLMFNVRGDENGRHAPPGVPTLDFLTGLGLLLGCGLLLRPWHTTDRQGNPALRWDWRGPFLFAAVALSLLPSALAVDAPHGMRSVGAAAFTCVIAALGWNWIWREAMGRVGSRQREPRLSRGLSPFLRFLPLTFCLLVLALNVYIYFFWMRTSTAVWVSFYPVHTQVGAYIRDLHEQGQDQGRQLYVPAGVAANPVFVYLTHGIPVRTYNDGALSEPVRPGALFFLSGYTADKDRATLTPYIGTTPQPEVTGPLFPDGSRPSFLAYQAQ